MQAYSHYSHPNLVTMKTKCSTSTVYNNYWLLDISLKLLITGSHEIPTSVLT